MKNKTIQITQTTNGYIVSESPTPNPLTQQMEPGDITNCTNLNEVGEALEDIFGKD